MTGLKRFFARYPLPFLLSAAVVLLLLAASFASTPFDYDMQDLDKRFLPPIPLEGSDPSFPLGTDQLGRDMLSRTMAGIRISFFLAFSGTLIGAMLGTTLGFAAARFGGIVDSVVLMLVDIQASLPFMLVAIALLSVVKNSFIMLVILLGFAGWERYARLTRGLSLSAQKHGYAVAVRTLGASRIWIFVRHILPNIASALIVNITLNFPGTMIAEGSLSFLGMGIQPPLVSLGRLLGEGRVYLLTAWWVTVFPGLVIFVATLAMTMIGDWVRDRLAS